jgi:hypothetical protein
MKNEILNPIELFDRLSHNVQVIIIIFCLMYFLSLDLKKSTISLFVIDDLFVLFNLKLKKI